MFQIDAGSVAEKNGRVFVGDQLIQVSFSQAILHLKDDVLSRESDRRWFEFQVPLDFLLE